MLMTFYFLFKASIPVHGQQCHAEVVDDSFLVWYLACVNTAITTKNSKIIFQNGLVLFHAQTEVSPCIAADLASSFKHTEHAYINDLGYSE